MLKSELIVFFLLLISNIVPCFIKVNVCVWRLGRKVVAISFYHADSNQRKPWLMVLISHPKIRFSWRKMAQTFDCFSKNTMVNVWNLHSPTTMFMHKFIYRYVNIWNQFSITNKSYSYVHMWISENGFCFLLHTFFSGSNIIFFFGILLTQIGCFKNIFFV